MEWWSEQRVARCRAEHLSGPATLFNSLCPAGAGRVRDRVIQVEILGYARGYFLSHIRASGQLARVEQRANKSIRFRIHQRSNAIHQPYFSRPRESEPVRPAMGKRVIASCRIPLQEVAGGVVFNAGIRR